MSDYPDEFIKWHNAKFDDISVSFSGHVIDRFEQWSEIKALQSRVTEWEGLVNEFVTEHCWRGGDDDLPLDADEQYCDIVKRAMKALSEVSDE